MPDQELSRDVLTMIEGFGLTGSWIWTFDDDRQRWSPGLHRLLGLHEAVAPDYRLIHALVHPEDRPNVMDAAELKRTGVMVEQRFRLLRGDGRILTVASRTETRFHPSGRPLRAMGVIADMEDGAALARARAAESRRSRALFAAVRAFTSTTWTYPFTDLSDEYVRLVGLPKDELLAVPTAPIVAEERRHWAEHGRRLYLAGQMLHTQPRLRLADGEVVTYRMVMVPVFDGRGRVESWSNYVAPLHIPVPMPRGIVRNLERRIGGAHLRAGRALLDWSMNDLAGASGLSVSTVRRLEGGDAGGGRSAAAAVAALRRHGVRFTLTGDAEIVLGRSSAV